MLPIRGIFCQIVTNGRQEIGQHWIERKKQKNLTGKLAISLSKLIDCLPYDKIKFLKTNYILCILEMGRLQEQYQFVCLLKWGTTVIQRVTSNVTNFTTALRYTQHLLNPLARLAPLGEKSGPLGEILDQHLCAGLWARARTVKKHYQLGVAIWKQGPEQQQQQCKQGSP